MHVEYILDVENVRVRLWNIDCCKTANIGDVIAAPLWPIAKFANRHHPWNVRVSLIYFTDSGSMPNCRIA